MRIQGTITITVTTQEIKDHRAKSPNLFSGVASKPALQAVMAARRKPEFTRIYGVLALLGQGLNYSHSKLSVNGWDVVFDITDATPRVALSAG